MMMGMLRIMTLRAGDDGGTCGEYDVGVDSEGHADSCILMLMFMDPR